MEDKEFSLLTEPWIRVMARDLSIRTVSLTEALANAHEYRALAGETPTQDVAILRLLLACVQTVFYRYDAEGGEDPIDEDWDEGDVLDRWKEYRDAGRFSEQCVCSYLRQYADRFWLFHPETPFYQVADLKYGTDYSAQGLLGNLKSSNNYKTKYHFSMNEGESIQRLPYADAARWLVNLNAYSLPTKKDEKAPGTTVAAGTGRLGRLGLIYADAASLFDLILRNLTPLKPTGEVWGAPKPVWEQPVRSQQSIAIAPPDNLPERYTLQSRRILLLRSDAGVTGVRVMNGDFFGFENDFDEPMTLWEKKPGENAPTVYMPKQHRKEVQVWREFPSIFITDKVSHMPGVVQWVNWLCAENLIPRDELITLRTAGIVYGGGQFSSTYGECLSDGLSLSSEILRGMGREWITLIRDEISKCMQVTDKAMMQFAKSTAEVLNLNSVKKTQESSKEKKQESSKEKKQESSKEKKQESLKAKKLAQKLSEEFYAEIDAPFREWLSGIRPEKDQKDRKAGEWEKTAYCAAKSVVQEKMEGFAKDLFVFRESEGNIRSIPQAYNLYLGIIRKIYPGVTVDQENKKE